MSVEELVVLARHLRDGLVLVTPSSPWTNGECWETKEHLGKHELISLPAYTCSTSYQTICPAARICPGTKTNMLKL